MTKVWGFREPAAPLPFPEKGNRESARRKLQPGDRVVLVGTAQPPTAPGEQGRVLAIVEPTTVPANTLDFVPEDLNRPEALNADGRYKWPYALLNDRAWMVDARPKFSTISDRKFGYEAVTGIVELLPDEAAKVERLALREVELLKKSASAERRVNQAMGRVRKISPPPTTTRTGVMHMRRAPASTYVFRLLDPSTEKLDSKSKNHDLGFKIGWAFDWRKRMKGFNKASMPSIGGIEYKGCLEHPWHTAREAYAMEQHLLRTFDKFRSPMNHEVVVGVSEDALHQAWRAYLIRNQ